MFSGESSTGEAWREKADPLALLLRRWNSDSEVLTPDTREALSGIVERELGLPEDPPAFHSTTVTGLADEIRPHLPRNRKNETLVDVFEEVRQLAYQEFGIAEGAVRWDAAWEFGEGEAAADLLTKSEFDFRDPNEIIGETARSIWKARGGLPFWEVAPYEHNWCASQAIFHDIVKMPEISTAAGGHAVAPATPLDTLIPPRELDGLLCSIEKRFGVWLGARPKEGCLPVFIAGSLVSPLSLFVAACVLISLGVKPGLWLLFPIYAGCIGVAVIMFIRSQPRLPETISTMKDLVRAVVRKRAEAVVRKPRIRPITMSSASRRTPVPEPRTDN